LLSNLTQPWCFCMKAEWNFSLVGLMEKLRDPGKRPNYDWIRQRISRTWPMWLHAAKNLAFSALANDTLSSRHRKRVRYHSHICTSVYSEYTICRDSTGTGTGTVPGRNNVASVRSWDFFCSRTCEAFLLDI